MAYIQVDGPAPSARAFESSQSHAFIRGQGDLYFFVLLPIPKLYLRFIVANCACHYNRVEFRLRRFNIYGLVETEHAKDANPGSIGWIFGNVHQKPPLWLESGR